MIQQTNKNYRQVVTCLTCSHMMRRYVGGIFCNLDKSGTLDWTSYNKPDEEVFKEWDWETEHAVYFNYICDEYE